MTQNKQKSSSLNRINPKLENFDSKDTENLLELQKKFKIVKQKTKLLKNI